MPQKISGSVLTIKTLVRIAITALSLSGMAHAHSVSMLSPQQSGNNYNFLAGGGG
ncbi:MAG: hypothetical protein QOH05_1510 [Acetobacteraceae bacterium]|jgi:hypothetical protein|nr:hypothetical protein [Acetobacteraceae bacterium]